MRGSPVCGKREEKFLDGNQEPAWYFDCTSSQEDQFVEVKDLKINSHRTGFRLWDPLENFCLPQSEVLLYGTRQSEQSLPYLFDDRQKNFENGFQNSSLEFKPIVLLYTPVLNFGSWIFIPSFFPITLVTPKSATFPVPKANWFPRQAEEKKNHINYFQNMTPVTQILRYFMGWMEDDCLLSSKMLGISLVIINIIF